MPSFLQIRKKDSPALFHLLQQFPHWILFLVWITAGWRVSAEEKKSGGIFRAACVKVDITPSAPKWLRGYGPRESNGVHDKIYHRILAMDDGQTGFYLVSTDACSISPSFRDEFCEQLKKETGISSGQIWWSTTHTHSAPFVGPQVLAPLFSKTLGKRNSMKPDVEHWEWVKNLLIKGIKEARGKLEPARLGIGKGEAFANINRRQKMPDGSIRLGKNPDGVVDRQFGLIRIERVDHSLIALVADYAIHGTVLGGRNRLISGDVPGHVAEYVEGKTGALMLFINGAEGNVAPLYSTRPNFARSRMGEFDALLGDKIVAASDSISRTSVKVTLSLGETVIETPRRPGLGWPESLAAYSGDAKDGGEKLVRIPVRTLIINRDTLIWSAPLELFSEIAMNIRGESPFPNTFYYGLTNGSLLYLPTKIAFSEGGYEPNVSPFTPQAEADFIAGVSRFIRDLHHQR